MRLILLILPLMLCGCLRTESQARTREVEVTTGVQGGQEVSLRTVRESDTTSAQSTGVDVEAVVKAGLAVVSRDIKGFTDALSAKQAGLESRLETFASAGKTPTLTGVPQIDTAALIALVIWAWRTFGPALANAKAVKPEKP